MVLGLVAVRPRVSPRARGGALSVFGRGRVAARSGGATVPRPLPRPLPQ